jgi:hypothetical protein
MLAYCVGSPVFSDTSMDGYTPSASRLDCMYGPKLYKINNSNNIVISSVLLLVGWKMAYRSDCNTEHKFIMLFLCLGFLFLLWPVTCVYIGLHESFG